jgi:hypothetical protein
MLFTSPVFTVSTYLEEPDTYNYGLDLLKEVGPRTHAAKDIFQNIIDTQTQLSTPLIDLFIDPGDGGETLLWKNKDISINDLRKNEK